jgi:cytochrome c oxidase subunit IV
MVETAKLRYAMRRGLWVFLVLVVLALGEYALAIFMTRGNLPYMVIMNLVDAALIAYFFMHVAQLWRREE